MGWGSGQTPELPQFVLRLRLVVAVRGMQFAFAQRRTCAVGYGAVLEDNMPWTEQRYPASMRKLPPVVRSKAIEIANALLAEGMEEGLAIRIAIAKGKQWAEHPGGTTP